MVLPPAVALVIEDSALSRFIYSFRTNFFVVARSSTSSASGKVRTGSVAVPPLHLIYRLKNKLNRY